MRNFPPVEVKKVAAGCGCSHSTLGKSDAECCGGQTNASQIADKPSQSGGCCGG